MRKSINIHLVNVFSLGHYLTVSRGIYLLVNRVSRLNGVLMMKVNAIDKIGLGILWTTMTIWWAEWFSIILFLLV